MLPQTQPSFSFVDHLSLTSPSLLLAGIILLLLEICLLGLVAWLSLDAGDNDLTRLLTYFAAALQTIESNIGQGTLVALQAPGTVNIEVVLTSLLNEIAKLPEDVVLITLVSVQQYRVAGILYCIMRAAYQQQPS